MVCSICLKRLYTVPLHSAYLAVLTVLRSFEVLNPTESCGRAPVPGPAPLQRTAAAIRTENAKEKRHNTVETRRPDERATNAAEEHLLDHLVAKLERGKHRDQQRELWCSCEKTARRQPGAAVQHYTMRTVVPHAGHLTT